MIRICTRILKFAIGVPRVDLNPREIKLNHKVDFFPIVGFKQQKLGACVLNQPANKNILTEEFVDQFYRFMLSYEYDHSVQNIWIESKDSVFSHGVDYKRLTEDKNYLDKLSKFAILFASINKPVFSQVSGGAKGVGAYLLSMITMPLGHTNTYMKIDDTMRGLTPLMGGTHRLSRLPLHIGYYLALTGDEFNFQEMTQIGYIKGTVCNDVKNSEIRSKLEEANLYFRQKPRYTDFDEQKLQQEQKQLVKKNKTKFESRLKYRQGQIISQSTGNLNLKFAVNQHLAASSDYYNTLNPYNSFSKERNINNYYKMRLQRPLQYLKQHNLVQVFQIGGIEIPRLDLAKIDYIFAQDSLQKIVQSLKEENSEWAQKAYRKITKSDPLALQLTFQLLKKAEKLPWIACLQNEFTVARRLVQKSKLKLKTYKTSSQFALINQYSNKSIFDVPRQVIDSYLSPGQGEYKLEHTVKSHSLHPYHDYYQIVPDSIRKYLNQQELNDSLLNGQTPQVMRFLNNNKINYSSQVFNLGILRKYVYGQLQLQKQKDSIVKRLNFISRNDRFISQYKNQRQAYLDSLPQSQLQNKIDESIKRIFNSKFEERFKDFEEKTANMIGLQNKLNLFKKIKDIILNNLLYNGSAYQEYQSDNTSYNGPIYFDPQGKDIYSSSNPYVTSNPALNELTKDLSKGLQLSDSFMQHDNVEMPTFSATPHLPLQERQLKERSVWELIKYRYDQKPEVWAEAYVYKQMVEQAARTSEELAGYLQWTFQNYYDLLIYSEKKKETYGEFAADIVTQIKTMRKENIQKLKGIEQQRKIVTQKNIFSKIYQYKDQQKMRQCFPYYVNQSVIPGQFRRAFLAVLDSTLKEFTEMEIIGQKKLLLKEELGVVDRWINKDITSSYTELLKNDVEYVTSYLQILMVKDMLDSLGELRESKKTLEEILEITRQTYNVDFYFSSNKVSLKDVHAKIFSFLYFLMDMHTQAKKNLKSPQSKLIDFINRLKQSHEEDLRSSLPYSFEGLMLMIAKDRRRIYDRYIGEQFISEPEFFTEHIARESKRTGGDIYRRKNLDQQIAKRTFKDYVNKHSNVLKIQKKSLIQNYFYYMMLFEKHIHQICGKDHFIPTGFINEEHIKYNTYCQKLFRPKSFEEWLNDELSVVIEQLLNERFEAEKKLSKGQLYLYDQSFNQKFKVANIKLLIQKKIEEEIYLLKNMFGQDRQYDFEATEEEKSDFEYTRTKRIIKNTDALKKLNNLTLTEQISLEYMSKAHQTQHMTAAEKLFARNQKQYLKNGMASRLPSKSYQRMARDLFAYPQEMNPVQTSEEIQLFKKTHISFSKSASEKIVLSNFIPEYKALSDEMKDQILDQMVSKIKAVQSL